MAPYHLVLPRNNIARYHACVHFTCRTACMPTDPYRQNGYTFGCCSGSVLIGNYQASKRATGSYDSSQKNEKLPRVSLTPLVPNSVIK